MLRDASHQQVIQKFSFIESLNIARGISTDKHQVANQIAGQPDLERAFNFVTEANLKSLTSNSSAGSSEGVGMMVTATPPPEPPSYLVPHSSFSSDNPPQHFSTNHQAKENRNYLGKILFALACSYCLFVLWWLFGHQGSKILTWVMGGKQIVLSRSDAEFISYMERSLDVIDRQLAAQQTESEPEQMVYIPVYTPNSNPPSLPLATNPQPSVISEPVSEALKIPTPPPLPEPTPLPPPETPPVPTASPAPQIATNSQPPQANYTLIGILELGIERSAALIKIDGQTKRFWEGETIGNSEWVLKSVKNQTATISHQGKTRSISVGETF